MSVYNIIFNIYCFRINGEYMNNELTIDSVYNEIRKLPKIKQLSLIERWIAENNLLQDIIDITIAKQRIEEEEEDYETFRQRRQAK